MPHAKYRPRIVIECSQEQKNVLVEHLEFGMQRRVLGVVLEDVINMLNEFGNLFVLYLIERRFSYRAQMLEYTKQRTGDSSENWRSDDSSFERADTPAATCSNPSST